MTLSSKKHYWMKVKAALGEALSSPKIFINFEYNFFIFFSKKTCLHKFVHDLLITGLFFVFFILRIKTNCKKKWSEILN
jgi:hypothetical protein